MNRASGSWQWDDVRFFLAVARAGSLSGAARALSVGHVTVGRRITLLEKRLGVTLLNRTPDGFATTSAGEAILRQCMAMESAALNLERIAAGRDSLVNGSVRVTTTEALAYQLVAPAIAALRQAYPQLQVDLTVGVRSLASRQCGTVPSPDSWHDPSLAPAPLLHGKRVPNCSPACRSRSGSRPRRTAFRDRNARRACRHKE